MQSVDRCTEITYSRGLKSHDYRQIFKMANVWFIEFCSPRFLIKGSLKRMLGKSHRVPRDPSPPPPPPTFSNFITTNFAGKIVLGNVIKGWEIFRVNNLKFLNNLVCNGTVDQMPSTDLNTARQNIAVRARQTENRCQNITYRTEQSEHSRQNTAARKTQPDQI